MSNRLSSLPRRRLLRTAAALTLSALTPSVRGRGFSFGGAARPANASGRQRASYNGRGMTPTWGLNTFYAYGLDSFYEDTILDAARAAVQNGLQAAGYRLFCIDDGWAAVDRDVDDNLVPHPDRFPSGLAATVAGLHDLGFEAGIYGDLGTRTCSGRPGSYGYEAQDAAFFVSQGFDYVKMDWCAAEGLDARERYTLMSEALRTSGRPITFSVCEWGKQRPWEWAPAIANSARTATDINFLYEDEPLSERYTNYHWACMLKNLDLNQHPEVSGPGFANDPDCLQTGNQFFDTQTQEVAQLQLWAVMGAPMLLGTDALTITPETLALVTHPMLRAVNQDPLALQGVRRTSEHGSEVWVKPLADLHSYAVVLFNRLDLAATASIDWRTLWPVDRAYVRDLWTGTELGTLSGGFTRNLQPHESLLLQVAPLT